MEFAVAGVSAALAPVITKLVNVISELKGTPNTDAESMRALLRSIEAFLEDHRFLGGCTSHTWRETIDSLRRLAEDIENCIDRFNAQTIVDQHPVKKKSLAVQFAGDIAGFKTRSEQTLGQLKSMRELCQTPQRDAATSSVQGQHDSPAAILKELHDSNKNQDRPVKLNSLLYFCMFPPDLPARINPLIRLWLAEAFVQTEEVAVNYLQTLIKLGIIRSIRESNNGKVKRCEPPQEMRMHISGLCTSESSMLFCDAHANLRKESPSRLSLYPEGNAISDLKLPDDLSHLRTLFVFPAGETRPSDKAILDFSRYGLLRVLDVKECANLKLGEEHLLAICGLLLLKYLSFGGSINRVPRKIGDLQQLETLELRGSGTVTVYEEVILLPRLKHLLGKFQLSRSDAAVLPGLGLGLGWTMARLQKHVGKKCRLETLAGFVVNKRKGFAQLMSHLGSLSKAEIHLEDDPSEKNKNDLASAITKFIRKGVDMPNPPRSLKLDVSTFSKELSQKFLDSIQPNGGSLFSFKLNAKLANFPQFVTQLSGIEELCLSSTTLDGVAMMTGLSMLTMLKFLKLDEDNLGPLTIEPQKLPALERLCLVGKHSIRDITIQDCALPRLISLHILCKYLGDLPGINISTITNLQEVALHSDVCVATNDAWETAAQCHPNSPRFRPIKNP